MYISFGELLVQILCPLLIIITIKLWEFFVYSVYKSFERFASIFPACSLLDNFQRIENLILIKFNLLIFLFVCLEFVLFGPTKKILPTRKSHFILFSVRSYSFRIYILVCDPFQVNFVCGTKYDCCGCCFLVCFLFVLPIDIQFNSIIFWEGYLFFLELP